MPVARLTDLGVQVPNVVFVKHSFSCVCLDSIAVLQEDVDIIVLSFAPSAAAVRHCDRVRIMFEMGPPGPAACTLPSKQPQKILVKQDGTPENFFPARFASRVNGTWQSVTKEISQTRVENR